jgi:7tm Odorant receptor
MTGDKVAINFHIYKTLGMKILNLMAFDVRNFSCEPSPRNKRIILIKNSIFLFCIFNFILFYILCSRKMLKNDKMNLDEITVFVNITGSGIVAVIRNSNLFLKRIKIGKIFTIMDKSYTESEAKRCGFLREIKIYQRMVKFTAVSNTLVVGSIVFNPLIIYATTHERKFMPISPFDESVAQLPVYPLALLWSMWFFLLSIIGSITSDALLLAMIVVINSEFKILKKSFEEIDGKSSTSDIIKLVDRHNEILTNVEDIEDIFSILLLSNYLSCMISICITGFHLSIADDWSKIINHSMYTFTSALQLFIQCYYGQMLKSSSENVVDGIYNCEWMKIKESESVKMLVFAMKRAMKPAKLTIMKLGKVTLEQFTTVRIFLLKLYIREVISFFCLNNSQAMSYSYSFFTLCQRLYFKENSV